MKWQEPPASNKQKGKLAYEDEAADLKANPKRWGIVRTLRINPETDSGRSIAYDIKTGKYRAFRPKGSFDAESHREWDDELGEIALHIYAQYLGDPE